MTDPRASQLHVADHLLGVGQPQRALEALDGAGQGAVSTFGLQLRARALLSLDRRQECVAAAERGLADAPQDLTLLSVLAAARSRLQDYAGAERALLQALRLAPSHPGMLRQYVGLLDRAGQLDKAERVLARAAELDPTHPDVPRLRAELALSRGDDRAAARHAREALAIDPLDPGVRATAGSAAAVSGRYKEASRDLRYAAASEPTDTGLRKAAREMVVNDHLALRPLRLLGRFNPVVIWMAGMLLVVVALVALPPGVAVAVVLGWFAFCVYSWVAPPVVAAWVRWRRGW